MEARLRLGRLRHVLRAVRIRLHHLREGPMCMSHRRITRRSGLSSSFISTN